ncbi:MAG: hypothetical protein H6730_22625 [Deltaproteobacteria bacterium]|nr:hypothetical protein [Deltaproteobacteria bacterium]
MSGPLLLTPVDPQLRLEVPLAPVPQVEEVPSEPLDSVGSVDVVEEARTSAFDIAPDLRAFGPILHANREACAASRAFVDRVRASAVGRLHDNANRLFAAEARVATYTDGDWAEVTANAELDRALEAYHVKLVTEAAQQRAAASQLGSVRVGGFDPATRARSAALFKEAEELDAIALEVRAARAALHQVDPVAAVLARHPEVDDAPSAERARIAAREFGLIRGRMLEVEVELSTGALDPLDLTVVVADRLQHESVAARAEARDPEAQAILSSLRGHARLETLTQAGAMVAVGGLSFAGMLLGGGVALVGGVAGAADGVRGWTEAARLNRAASADEAGGAALVDGDAARKTYALATASLLLTALDVAQVAGTLRAMQVRNLYGAAEALEGVSAHHVRKLDQWVRQRVKGDVEGAARTREGLERALGPERWAKVAAPFEQVIGDLSAARVARLREGLGVKTFTRLGARFGGEKVFKWVNAHGAPRVRSFAEALPPSDAAALLEGLDARTLARLDPLPPAHVHELAGRLGLDGLRTAARDLDGASLRALDEAFGADLGRVLKVVGPEDWADPAVIGALASRDRAAVLEALGRGTRPKTLATVVQNAERHLQQARLHARPDNPIRPDLDLADDMLDYLRTQRPEEAEAAARMLEAELLDDGHAILRHGPQISDAAIVERLRTGVAADGTQGMGHWASTRFRSFRVMERSREAAWKGLMEVEKVDPRFGPGVGGNPLDGEFTIIVEHGKEVSRGVYSAAAPTSIPHPTKSWQTVRVYGQHVDSGPAITRTQATFAWEGGRWKVVQHFPGVKDFDKTAGVYKPVAPPHVTLKESK